MPYCILEYTANVIDQFDPKILLGDLHTLIINSGLFELNKIKSRIVKHENFLVGDGDPKNSFIYLQIRILDGRDEEVRKLLSSESLKILERTFPKTLESLNCSMTVEVCEIDRATHARSTMKDKALKS